MSRTQGVTATEPQLLFYHLDAVYKLLVGGFGSGKTEGLIFSVCMDIQDGRGADVAVFAPIYKHLKTVLMPRISANLTKWGIKHTCKVADMVIITHSPNYGNIVFLSLDKPDNIISYEFYRCHIDELDTLPLLKANEAWNMIIGRTRKIPSTLTRDTVKNTVSVYTTPEGFNFAYQKWGDNPSKEYQKVHASSYSNPYLPPAYIKNLKRDYPSYLANAYIEGQFVNLTSGTVYRSFDRKRDNTNEVYKDGEEIIIGQDFNIDKMASTIYVRRPHSSLVERLPNSRHNIPQIALHAVDEISDAYNTPAVIEIIKTRYPNSHVIVVPDSSGNNRSTIGGSSESDISLLSQAGFEIRVNAANPRVKDRVMATNAAFEKELVKINIEKCPRTVQCLEQQAYDKNGQPDKTAGVDHQNDATTYPLAYFYPIHKPVASFKFSY